MLPPKIQLPPDQQRLLRLFRAMTESQQQNLLSYAEYLAQLDQSCSDQAESAALAVPADIPRPESESVVAAIRRLSETFPMLDKDQLLHETSELMTSHLMQGRQAGDVIDELEAVFRRHYERVNSSGNS